VILHGSIVFYLLIYQNNQRFEL